MGTHNFFSRFKFFSALEVFSRVSFHKSKKKKINKWTINTHSHYFPHRRLNSAFTRCASLLLLFLLSYSSCALHIPIPLSNCTQTHAQHKDRYTSLSITSIDCLEFTSLGICYYVRCFSAVASWPLRSSRALAQRPVAVSFVFLPLWYFCRLYLCFADDCNVCMFHCWICNYTVAFTSFCIESSWSPLTLLLLQLLMFVYVLYVHNS